MQCENIPQNRKLHCFFCLLKSVIDFLFYFTIAQGAKTWTTMKMNLDIILISLTAEAKESPQVVLHWL